MNKIMQAKVDDLRRLLESDESVRMNAILCLYDLQTQSEREDGCTKDRNGVGFTRYDGEILSDFACKIRAGVRFSPKMRDIVQKRLPKYAEQLLPLLKTIG